MTRDEAMAEARRRWKAEGAIEYRPKNNRYIVGTIGANPGHEAIGVGDSWEAAFANADKNAADKRAREEK